MDVVATKYDPRTEIACWQALGINEHCVQLEAVFNDDYLYYMVMEKCACTVLERWEEDSDITEADLLRLFTEMLKGIKHVHRIGLVHRDINPESFMMGGAKGSRVKLSDFGSTVQMPVKGLLFDECGSPSYMSPQMVSGAGYDKLTDIWSFGVTAFLMVHGDFPYPQQGLNAEEIKEAIRLGAHEIEFAERAQEEHLFSLEFVDKCTPFLRALLARSPSSRPSASEALSLLASHEARRSASTVSSGKALREAAKKAMNAARVTRELSSSPDALASLDEMLDQMQEEPELEGEAQQCCSESTAAEDDNPTAHAAASEELAKVATSHHAPTASEKCEEALRSAAAVNEVAEEPATEGVLAATHGNDECYAPAQDGRWLLDGRSLPGMVGRAM